MDSFLSTIDTIFKTATEPFATPAVIILDKTYDLTSWLGEPSFGLAIIILAVTVAAALYPFRYVQYQATDSVVKLFTLHKERMAIIRKHKDDENPVYGNEKLYAFWLQQAEGIDYSKVTKYDKVIGDAWGEAISSIKTGASDKDTAINNFYDTVASTYPDIEIQR